MQKPFDVYYGIAALNWSPDETMLGVIGEQSEGIEIGLVSVYDSVSWERVENTFEIESQLNYIVWNPSSTTIAVAGKPDNAYIFRINSADMTGQAIGLTQSYDISTILQWVSDNQIIASISGVLTLIDADTGINVNRFSVPVQGGIGEFGKLSKWNESAKSLLFTTLGELYILHVPTGTQFFHLISNYSVVDSLDWSVNNQIAVTGLSFDPTLEMWQKSIEVITVPTLPDITGTPTQTPIPTSTPYGGTEVPTTSTPTPTPLAIGKILDTGTPQI